MASTMRFFAERWICGVLCHTILLHPQGDGTPWVCSRGISTPWCRSCWSCTQHMPTVAGNAQHFFGFGGDDDFYILCIGIHINQAVKEDDVFGNCSNLCGSWNKYERVHNPSTENHSNPMVSSEAAMATLRSNMWRPTAVSYQSIGWFCGTTTPTTSWRLGWKLPFQQVELQRDEIEKDRLGGVHCKYIIYCIKTHIIWYFMLLYVLIWCAHTHIYIYIDIYI